jgi:hypothetical protein
MNKPYDNNLSGDTMAIVMVSALIAVLAITYTVGYQHGKQAIKPIVAVTEMPR